MTCNNIETKVFVYDCNSNWEELGLEEVNKDSSDVDWANECQRQLEDSDCDGGVFTLQEFQNLINSDSLNLTNHMIRFIEEVI